MKISGFNFLFLCLCFSGIFGLMTLEGKILVKGNEPHTYVVIQVSEKEEYSITGKFKDILQDKYQNQTVKLQGMITKKSKLPGFPSEFEVKKIINAENLKK